MASIRYRVAGQFRGKQVTRRFRNTDEGRKSASAFAKTLVGPTTFYDVRARIDGREVTHTFARRKDADAYAATTEADKLRGVAIDPRRSKVTFRVNADEWLVKRHDLSVRTVELYRGLLDRHILPTFAAKSIGSISPSWVRTWHAGIASDHQTTAAKAYRLLRQIMNTAMVDEIITRNPCQVRGAGQERAPERPVASIAEVQALADAMPEHLRIRCAAGRLVPDAARRAAWAPEARRGPVPQHHLDHYHPDHDLYRDNREGAQDRGSGDGLWQFQATCPPRLKGHLATFAGPEPDAPVLVGEKGSAVIPGVLHAAWVEAAAPRSGARTSTCTTSDTPG